MNTSHHHRQEDTKPAGFTLLELLVVMAIISMLMSIMMPSLNQAKQIAKTTVCQSNLRQFHLAWTLYAGENNDKLCAADTHWNGVVPWGDSPEIWGTQGNFWVSDGAGVPYNDFCGTETAIKKGVLWPYIEKMDFYKCKSDTLGFIRSYAISHAMGSIYNYNYEWNFYKTGEITRPSQKTVFLDIDIFPERLSDGTMTGVGKAGSIDLINEATKEWSGSITRMTFRHNKGFNMSFADGHSEHYKWKDKRSMDFPPSSLGNKRLRDNSINNPDIPALTEAFRGARDRQW